MGQYYLAIILGEQQADGKEILRLALDPLEFANGMKLTEHSYIGNDFVCAVEYMLSPNGMFYKSRVVWAGDYADNEPGTETNLFLTQKPKNLYGQPMLGNYAEDVKQFRYIVNHTTKQYVDKYGKYVHPLPLLTAEGNGRGGGDYSGLDETLVGIWARHVISVESELPSEPYEELVCQHW